MMEWSQSGGMKYKIYEETSVNEYAATQFYHTLDAAGGNV